MNGILALFFIGTCGRSFPSWTSSRTSHI